MTARDFHLGDILSVTTECLVSPTHVDGALQLLNWMTGESLFIHQLPRAGQACRGPLLKQHPLLASVAFPDGLRGEPAVREWLDGQVAVFGETLPVEPLPSGAYSSMGPLSELARMMSEGVLDGGETS